MIGFFPGEGLFGASEVAVAGGGQINRAEELEVTDNGVRGEGKDVADNGGEAIIADGAGAGGVNLYGDRLGYADGISELNFTLLGQAGGDDVLGNVASHVGSGTIDLGRILAAESAAAVTAGAAIGIDDYFPAGYAAIAVGAAENEPAGGVDVHLELAVCETLGQDG